VLLDGAQPPRLPDLPLPVSVLRLADLDRTGAGRAALGSRPGESWLIRPDGHIAAVLPDPAAVPAAAVRALGGTLRG
jgi:3-(3-hydroxy-phenyl)propionate hydroxylase